MKLMRADACDIRVQCDGVPVRCVCACVYPYESRCVALPCIHILRS